MRDHLKFSLPEKYSERRLTGALSDHYVIKKEHTVLARMAIYDTFDWRLFGKSLVLFTFENKLFLRKLFKNEIVHSAEIKRTPVFIKDLPDSDIKAQLTAIIKMRALFKLVELKSRSTAHRILNRDKKTVASMVYDEIRPAREKNAPVLETYLWLQPVKGYTKQGRNLVRRLKESGFEVKKKDDIYFKAMAAAGKSPGSYSSKLKIQLDPAVRSDEAAKIILRRLLQIMKINETNLENAPDTEFLHDFRVAIRRTRSALSQIKSVFPQTATDRFKKDFSFVGKLSNQLRDLDVFLLREEAFKMMIPPVLRDDIDPLFDYLRKKRSKALQKVVRSLRYTKYKKIMRDWEAFLNEPLQDPPQTSNANVPIVTLARKRIYRQYRRIAEDGSRILENTDDEKLHSLRIECKKLRYLMEFFSSLFLRKKIKMLIRQLKKLQDNLGDFNNLCIQEGYLLKIAEELAANGRENKKVLVAIGSLIGALDVEKRMAKEAFAKTFLKYASPLNDRLFRELFALK